MAWTLHEDRSGRLRSGESVEAAVAARAGLPVGGCLANCCAPESIPRALGIEVNLDVLVFAILVTGLTGLLVGLAPALFGALQVAEREIARGNTDPESVKQHPIATIPSTEPSLKLEYLDIVDPGDLQPVSRFSGTVLVAGALWVGSTRLIDNVVSQGHG